LKAFGFLFALILVIGAAMVLSLTMSRNLHVQLEDLKARL
jgi:hypothetical protein